MTDVTPTPPARSPTPPLPPTSSVPPAPLPSGAPINRRLASRPRPRARWVVPAIIVGVLWSLGLTGFLYLRDRREHAPGFLDVADLFAQRLAAANKPCAGAAKPGETPPTGYQAAWDLLSDAKKTEMPFDVFYEDWSKLFDARGYIVDVRRAQRSAVRTKWSRGRTVAFTLLMGSDSSRHEDLSALLLELNLREENDRFTVTDYAFSDIPNPSAK